MLLLDDRSYITQECGGWVIFGIDAAQVCRRVRKLETHHRSYGKPRKIPVERPQHRQKIYDSGKKKRPTVKTELRMTQKKRRESVPKTHPGSVHDVTILKEGGPFPKRAEFL
jgi:hypothetical protein